MEAWKKHLLEGRTAEQQEAIISTEPLTVVSAGAGAGKTQTLAQRFAYLLASDKECETNKILVLTFTEKAAQEMRDRIERQLKKLYKDFPKALPFLQERISQLDDTDISTIHSFAMKMTREAGLSLDIDPAFTIASDPFEDLFWEEFKQAIDEISETKIKRLANLNGETDPWQSRITELFADKNFPELLNEYRPDKIVDVCKKAVSTYSSMGKSCDWLYDFSNSNEIDRLQQQYANFKEETLQNWQNAFTSESFAILLNKPVKGDRDNDLATLYNFRQETPDIFAEQLLLHLSNLSGGTKEFKNFFKANFGGTAKEYRDEFALIFALLAKPTKEETETCSLLNKIAALAWHCWEQRKAAANCLSMDDLILRAKEVLSSSADYANRYKHIMIDEFQDTDPLQNELLKKLWKGLGAEQPNTLFIVGDLKQSIYRFRHADLTLFRDYINLADNAENAKYIELDKNFRSSSRLLDVFNDTFEAIWKEKMGNVDISYQRLNPPNEKTEINDINPLDIITFTQQREGQKKHPQIDVARFELYKALAERIRSQIGQINVYDKKLKIVRPCSWRDFTILVPRRNAYGAIEKAFDYAGIPYSLCTSKDYYGRDEIKILINLLNLLASPDDDFALANWLASPFCNLEAASVEQMLSEAAVRTAERAKQTKDRKVILLLEVVKEKYPYIVKNIEYLRSVAQLRGVPAVLRELLTDMTFLKFYEASQRRRVYTNLSNLIDVTAEYEASIGKSLAACAKYLQDAVINQQQKQEPDIIDDSHDTVRIMTLHASKGLQFPITVIGETQKDTKSDSSTIHVSPILGIIATGTPSYLLNENQKPLPFVANLWHKEIDSTEAKAEDERCWYVGMTRAEEKLIMCGIRTTSKSNKETGYSDKGFLERILNGEQIAYNENAVKMLNAEDINTNQTKDTAKEIELSTPLAITPKQKPILSRITASAYALLSWCPYAYRKSFRQGIKMDWENEANGEENISGQAFGNLVHYLIKEWDFTQNGIETILSNSMAYKLPAELRKTFTDKKIQLDIKNCLATFASTSLCKQLATIEKEDRQKQDDEQKDININRESSFRARNSDIWMMGTVDLYWKDGNNFHIIDWKTGADAEALNAYYKPQLDFYAVALWLHKKENKPDVSDLAIDAGLVHLREPENIALHSYTDEELEQIAHNILQAAQLACGKDFPTANDKCSACPWKSSCDKAK